MGPDLELHSTPAVVEVSAADANYGGVGTYHLAHVEGLRIRPFLPASPWRPSTSVADESSQPIAVRSSKGRVAAYDLFCDRVLRDGSIAVIEERHAEAQQQLGNGRVGLLRGSR